jgi:replicative DNA helicase
MTKDSSLTKITEIIVNETVNKKIPTVVFMSIKTEDLVKNLFLTLKSGNKDERSFSQEDWNQVAEIMQKLSGIPLLLKETADVNYIKTETQTFITGMEGRKGLVIINLKENISEQNFIIDKENISIMIIN